MSYVGDMDIELDEKAEEQRVVEENRLAELLAVAKQKRAEAEREQEEQKQADLERAKASARTRLIELLSTGLGLELPPERVWFTSESDLWLRPVVLFAGRSFSYQCINRRDRVVVAVSCSKCHALMWRQADSQATLLEALESPFSHAVCPSREDDDFEIVEPTPSLAELYTAAIKRRRDLQFERAKVKELAVRRIVANKGITVNGEAFVVGSATAAEKLVEFDEEFAAICTALTEAVITEIGAREALRAAGGNPSKEDEEA